MTRAHHIRSYVLDMSSGTSQDQYGDWYEIRIQGRLDDRWSAWLNGFDLSHTDDGATVLRGPVTDQAALHGLLHKVRDIGLPLVSVTRTDPDPST
jgi:hypothetical protein